MDDSIGCTTCHLQEFGTNLVTYLKCSIIIFIFYIFLQEIFKYLQSK